MRTVSALGMILAMVSCAPPPPGPASPPDHLVILVFDQMRPDYIDRFNLEQFKRLRASSRHYPDAYVGHLAAQTVVSHLVIPTGLAPKDLPWHDDAMLDVAGQLGKPNAAYQTDDLTRDQMWRLLDGIPRSQFLQSRMRDALGPVYAIGEKSYAATVFGGPHASTIVTLNRANGRCTPDGVNVPAYIADNPRFSLDCAETYGTGLSTIYALDGSRYVPGRDTSRQGGDVWTADVALEVMRRDPSWRGLFLTFGGIDKVAHMLGEQDGPGLASVPSQYRLEDVLRIADEQLGRVLDELEAHGLADRTMVVVTADHGGQRYESYLGNNRSQSCCPFENSEPAPSPFWLEHLNNVGKLQTAYADSVITLWLADHSEANERALILGLQDVSGVTEVYAKRVAGDGFRYEQTFARLETQSAAFRSWAERHSAELVNTMAAKTGPDLVALMADGFGFGRIGGHGGAQEKVQRIPMIIHVPGETASIQTRALRLVDVAPEISMVMFPQR